MATFAQFLWAIGQQESGGDYQRTNSIGALGKYQILTSNLPSWLTDSGLPPMTPQQFLNNPSAQDQVAATKLKPYFDSVGPQGAAAWWYSGQTDPTKTYGNPSVASYVSQVMNRLSGAPAVTGSTGTTNGQVQQAGLGSDIAGSIAQGMLSSFGTVLKPVLDWGLWFAETALGAGVMIFGIILMVQSTDTAKKVEAMGMQTTPAGRAAAPRVVAAPIPKPARTKRPSNVNPYSGTKTKTPVSDAQKNARDKAAAERRANTARAKDAQARMKAARNAQS